MPVLLGLVLYVVVEVAAAVAVASWIGVGWTLLLLLGLSLLGLVLLRREGARAWRAFSAAVAEGRPPGPEALNGMLVLLGGAADHPAGVRHRRLALPAWCRSRGGCWAGCSSAGR